MEWITRIKNRIAANKTAFFIVTAIFAYLHIEYIKNPEYIADRQYYTYLAIFYVVVVWGFMKNKAIDATKEKQEAESQENFFDMFRNIGK